jgi:hypothetical protein
VSGIDPDNTAWLQFMTQECLVPPGVHRRNHTSSLRTWDGTNTCRSLLCLMGRSCNIIHNLGTLQGPDMRLSPTHKKHARAVVQACITGQNQAIKNAAKQACLLYPAMGVVAYRLFRYRIFSPRLDPCPYYPPLSSPFFSIQGCLNSNKPERLGRARPIAICMVAHCQPCETRPFYFKRYHCGDPMWCEMKSSNSPSNTPVSVFT